MNVGPRSATVMWLVQNGAVSVGLEPGKVEKTAPDAPPAGITKKVASVENFAIVQVDGNSARLEARTPGGVTLEVTDLTYRNAGSSSAQ